MELLEILRALLRRWWLIAIPLAAGIAAAAPDVLNASATSGGFSANINYTAFQDPNAIERPEGDYQDLWLSSELLVNALTNWVRGSQFREDVARLLERQERDLDLAGLGITSDNERSVGQIFLSYPDADGLRAIMDAVTEVLSLFNADYFPQLGTVNASVTILHRTGPDAAPPSLPNRFAPLLKVAVGLGAGIALAALAHYLDPMVRRRREVEAAGIPVLASLPRH
jgi:capsular polysaccharide biosynthesis protein